MMIRRLSILLFPLAMLAPLGAAAAADDGACDRHCMTIALDSLLDSMVQNNVSTAPLAEGYRGTENQRDVTPGDGLWRTTMGLGPLQRRFFDEAAHQAAYYGYIRELTGPALLSLRVKFDGRRIVESEAIVARAGEPLYNIQGAVQEQPRDDAEVHKTARKVLEHVANAYFDGLAHNSGDAVPKVDGCERVENGTRVTHRSTGEDSGGEARSGDCTDGFEKMTSIADVGFRRFPVADTMSGVVLGVGLFQRPPGATDRQGNPRKRNLIHEYFATRDGRISEIFAVMHYVDQDAPNTTGW